MKTIDQDSGGQNILLAGCILAANLDFNGLLDYGLKAALGGLVWLGVRLAADYVAERKKRVNK